MKLARYSYSILWVALMRGACAQVPVDHIPNALTLPPAYPDSWVFVYSMPQADNFIVGAYSIVDVAAATNQYKGLFQGAFLSSLIAPRKGTELYVAESFLEQAGHGRRRDVLTITDKSHLSSIAEIPLSAGKRGILEGNRLDVTHDGTFMLVFNFTPAASVTVVDLHKRRVVGEVPTPGCTSIYPSGPRGFCSLCADGSLVTFDLGDKGQVLHEARSLAFNDIDHDVLYLEPTTSGAITYFVTERGSIRPIEMMERESRILPAWVLITPEEVADGWKTAPGTLTASDEAGHLYVRVYRETGYDKQVSDNTEVWVFDLAAQKRVRRIPMKNGADSIEVTPGSHPYLVVVAESDPVVGESLDVYDASTGDFLRTIGGWWQGTQLSLVQATR